MSNEGKMRRVAIATRMGSREAIRVAEDLSEWLLRRGLQVFLDGRCLRALEIEAAQIYDPVEAYDLVIVLGGDGTLMSVARAQVQDAPILGVNLGRLGFLTELSRSELYPCIVDVLAGRFETEERSLLDADLVRSTGTSASYRALNDVVVSKSALARIIDLRVEVDAQLVAHYRSDGLILSTPTGSTAYNLSAGGPIIFPSLPVVVVTPICPHTLSHRPLVVPDNSLIELTLETRDEEVYLTMDGQEGTTLGFDDHVRVRSSDKRIRLIKSSGRSFYDSLRGKLGWGS